jgi:hypothetical protein
MFFAVSVQYKADAACKIYGLFLFVNIESIGTSIYKNIPSVQARIGVTPTHYQLS